MKLAHSRISKPRHLPSPTSGPDIEIAHPPTSAGKEAVKPQNDDARHKDRCRSRHAYRCCCCCRQGAVVPQNDVVVNRLLICCRHSNEESRTRTQKGKGVRCSHRKSSTPNPIHQRVKREKEMQLSFQRDRSLGLNLEPHN